MRYFPIASSSQIIQQISTVVENASFSNWLEQDLSPLSQGHALEKMAGAIIQQW